MNVAPLKHPCRWLQLDAWPFAILYAAWLVASISILASRGWEAVGTIKLGTYALVLTHVS